MYNTLDINHVSLFSQYNSIEDRGKGGIPYTAVFDDFTLQTLSYSPTVTKYSINYYVVLNGLSKRYHLVTFEIMDLRGTQTGIDTSVQRQIFRIRHVEL